MILDILLLERTRKIPTGFRPSSSCATGTEHAVARSAGPGRPLFFLLAHALAQQLAGRGGQGMGRCVICVLQLFVDRDQILLVIRMIPRGGRLTARLQHRRVAEQFDEQVCRFDFAAPPHRICERTGRRIVRRARAHVRRAATCLSARVMISMPNRNRANPPIRPLPSAK